MEKRGEKEKKMAREFIVPGRIISGAGALDAAGAALKEMGKKALVVTDKVMVQLGNCARLEAALAGQGIGCVVYDEITGEPTDTMIENGLKIYQDNGCDFLVALGGGSPIDSMKAIASLVKNGGSISDYMGKIIGLFRICHHRDEQMRDAVVDAQFHHLGIDHYQFDLLGAGFI